MLRMEETEDEVDLRPRSPAEERLNDECGVRGEGDRDSRFRGFAVRWYGVRLGLGGCCADTGTPEYLKLRFSGEGLAFVGLFSGGGFRVEESLLEPGDLARLAESKNHCLIDAR